MFTIENPVDLKEKFMANVVNADVFVSTNKNSTSEEHERMDSLHETLLAITDTLTSAKDLSKCHVVTGHIEGDSPITKAVFANSDGEARLGFTLLVLEDLFGSGGRDSEEEEPEVHIDCSFLLSSLVSADNMGSLKSL